MGPDVEKSPKAWDAMNMDEKFSFIKKMLDQIANLMQSYNGQNNALQQELREHRHDEEGKSYIKLTPGSHTIYNGNNLYGISGPTNPYGSTGAI